MQVHPKQLVVSDVSVCLLMVGSDKIGCSHADALMTALQLRPDVKCSIYPVVLDIPDTLTDGQSSEQTNAKRLCKSVSPAYVHELLQECLTEQLPFNLLLVEGIDGKLKVPTVFFLTFGPLLAQLADNIVGAVTIWNERLLKEIDMLPVDMATYYRKHGLVYGIHFTDLKPVDELSLPLLCQTQVAPVLCSDRKHGLVYGIHFTDLKPVDELSLPLLCQTQVAPVLCSDSSLPVRSLSESSVGSPPSDGCLISGNTSPVYLHPSHYCSQAAVFPVLLYMLQLSTGENGTKQGPLLSSGTATVSSSVGSLVSSSWSAWEVLTEVQHVMSGLSSDCELRVLGHHRISESMSLDSHEAVSASDMQSQTATAEKSMSSQKFMPSSEDNSANMAAIEQHKHTDSNCGDRLECKTRDLPLMSNILDICVRHYLLDLTVEFGRRAIIGSIVLFLTALKDSQCPITADTLRLDCCDLDILAVEEPVGIDNYFPAFDGNGRNDTAFDATTIGQFTQRWGFPLTFEVEKWHMSVYRGSERAEFPRCVRITFRTRPKGKSLSWADDVDGRY